jgi:hypothetical protein
MVFEVVPLVIEIGDTESNELEEEVREADELILTVETAIAEVLILQFHDGNSWFTHPTAMDNDAGDVIRFDHIGLKYRLQADGAVAATRTVRVLMRT